MNLNSIYILLIALLAAIVILILFRLSMKWLKKNEAEKSILDMRKVQSTTNFRENQLKQKLEELLESRVKKTKKNEIETLCMQAGFEITYGEYRMIGLFIAAVVFLAILTAFHNPIMAFIFAITFFFAPGQVIEFIRNRRIAKLDHQVGSFMRLVTERYSSTKDFAQAIRACVDDFEGLEPMYSELRKTTIDLDLGLPVTEAMRRLSKRVGNSYLKRLTEYYEISADLGTVETRTNLLKQALIQYEENRSMKSKLRNELNGPVREAYLIVGVVPFIGAYMYISDPNYGPFMFGSMFGQLVLSAVFVVMMLIILFINKQIGKPLE